MVSVLSNFVAVRQTRSDVLSPTEYRSIVEMIKGFLKTNKFLELSQNYKRFQSHVKDFNDPHEDRKNNYFDELVEQVYLIYVTMTELPLSLTGFKTEIVPSVDFLELIRRIVLNRYLYNQVKRSDGSIPLYSSASFTKDWDSASEALSPIRLKFPTRLPSEKAFVRSGLNNNTQPLKTILTAESLVIGSTGIPLIFETSAAAPFSFHNIRDPQNVPLQLLSKSVTVKLAVRGKPDDTTVLVTLSNGYDVFKLVMYSDRTLGVILNNNRVAKTLDPADENDIVLLINEIGSFSLTTSYYDIVTDTNGTLLFLDDASFDRCGIGLPHEDLTNQQFGLKYMSIYEGSAVGFEQIYIVDEHNVYVTDENGSYVVDSGKYTPS